MTLKVTAALGNVYTTFSVFAFLSQAWICQTDRRTDVQYASGVARAGAEGADRPGQQSEGGDKKGCKIG